jgi:ribosomal protein S18 acetylase RimI-like enzyme
VRIRPATPTDADALAAVQVTSWQRAYRGIFPDEYLDGLDAGRWRTGWQRMLAETDWPRRGTLLAETPDGELTGFADVRPTRDDDAGDVPTGELTSIYLSPQHWGTGAGRELLSAATEQLRQAGFTEATLWVLEGNTRARRFYASAGWRPDGARKDAVIAGVPVVEVRYRRRLRGGGRD